MVVMSAVVMGVMGVYVLVVDVRVEPVVLVGRVGHLPDATVRLVEAVPAVHHVPVPFFPLFLVVFGVRVFDAVFERVLRRRLRTDQLPC